jgi:NAD(P)-dependent dehydrogenase (short-subunit alcohol dehydrogenase family)
MNKNYSNILVTGAGKGIGFSTVKLLLKKGYYVYALIKILPNLMQAIKKIIVNILKLNMLNVYISLIEVYGIFSSILLLKSFYRPKI